MTLLLAGLIVTALIVQYTKIATQREERRNFDFICNEIQLRILERLKEHETILRSGAAFYDRIGQVSRQEWHRFVGLLQIEQRFPGIQGIGFAQLIRRQELTQHLQQIRDEGFPAYQVRPEGDREIYSSIIYLEPFTKRNLRAFGYDMFSEPVRRAAMEKARDENTAILSGKVILVQETGQGVQAGTLLYVPVFRREMPIATVVDRRAALLGWVYSPYRMNDLMEGLMEGRNLRDDRHIHLEIFDGGSTAPETELYDSSISGSWPLGTVTQFTLQRGIVSAGRPWTLSFARVQPPLSFWTTKAWLVWFGGTSISLFLSGLIFTLLNTRARAEQLAEQLTMELRTSEEKFRAIANYTAGWELWFGGDGKILWMNPGTDHITGYSPAEILAMPDFISTLIVPEDRPAFHAIIDGVLFGGAGDGQVFQCVSKDGAPFWLSISWQPILDKDGRPIGVRASGRNVTALKRAENDLRRANWVVEQVNNAILITDSRAIIEYVNHAFTRITGYAKDEAVGKNPHFLTAGQTNQAIYEDMWLNLMAGRSWRGELMNQKKTGEIFWEIMAISPLRDAAGQITHYVAIKQDITEHKRLQLELEESEARFTHLAEQSGTIGWEVDAQGLYTYVSPVSISVLGYRPDELVGRMHFYDLHPAAGREAFKASALAVFARQEPFFNLVNPAQTKSGRQVWFSTNGSAHFNADGSLLGTRGSDTDITAHWLAEKALEDSLANFRTFFESITDMIFVGNSGGKLIFANPAVLPTLGYSAEELMTMHLLDLHPGDQRQEAEAIFAAMLRGERASCLLPIVRKDGSLVPVETRVWSGQWNGMNCLFAVAKNLSVEQEAQQLFERLFRSNPSLMALSELSNRRFSDANDAFLHTLGYSRAEIVGKTAADLNLFPNEEQQTAAREYLLSAGRVANVELQIQRKDGKILIGLFSGEIIRSQGRQFFLTVMNNITELKQMQSALKESNDRLHMAAQAGGVGIWDYNVLDNQLVWDDQMFRLYGIQRSQFSGEYKDLLKGVHPADQQRGHEEIQLALRGGGNFDTEFRVVWPNGSIHDIRALAVVQRDAAGLPLRLIGTNWDITAEKLAATTLRWNQELLQLMASSSPLGFLVVDNRTDAILHFNQRFCAIWGIEHLAGRLRRGELKNNDLIPYCLPALSDVPAFAASCAPLQDEANRIVLEDEIAFTGHRTIRRFTTQIRDAADRYYGRFYIFEDISERKNREALSASLLEREREVSEMKSRFISTMSHEFRTPMAAAMGSTELLANHFDRFAPEKRRELLGRVSSSIQRMTIMLDEVLLLSQLEGKRVAMRLTPIELSAFLRDAVEDIQLGDRDAHRFEFCPAAKVATIFADPKLLHHIFSNVLSNAVRYSPPGTLIKVRIEADDQQVWVAVQDRGIGILPADLARIFKPFERGANVGNIPGTGIGLNLVKQMTEMLGGTIAADPVADGGTCFTLVFPSHPASGTSA